MKRATDHDDNVYFRVNEELARVVRDFSRPTTNNDNDNDINADITAQKEYVIDIDGNDSQYGGDVMPLGFKPGASHAEIPGIRRLVKRPDGGFPREDGYEDSFYEKQQADERPFGARYFDKDLERRRLLEANEDYRFVVLLAGAMGKQVIDLYEEEDLERLLRQREADRLRIQQELKRSIVSMQAKENQRNILVGRKNAILRDLSVFQNDHYAQLIDMGSFLVDGQLVGRGVFHGERYGLVALLLLQLDLRLLTGETGGDVTQEERETREEVVCRDYNRDGKKLDSDKQKALRYFSGGTNQQVAQNRAAFTAISLFHLVLDQQAAAWTSAAAVLRACQSTVDQMMAPRGNGTLIDSVVEALQDNNNNDREDLALALLPSVNDIVGPPLPGTQTVDMGQLERYYSDTLVSHMVQLGLDVAYGGYELEKLQGLGVSYADVVWDYISADGDDDEAAAQALRLVNFERDHPKPLQSLVRHVLQQRGNRDGTYDEATVRYTLRAHFVWHYFHARTAQGLAIDWHENDAVKKRALVDNINNNNNPLRELLVQCDDLMVQTKALLMFYFYVVLRVAGRNKVPVVLSTSQDKNASMFKFPPSITEGGGFVYEREGALDNDIMFDELNAQFTGAATTVTQYINNAQFKHFYETGEAVFIGREQRQQKSGAQQVREASARSNEPDKDVPIPNDADRLEPYATHRYTILRLHLLMASYVRFIALYRKFLQQQQTQVEGALIDIDRIMARMASERSGGGGGGGGSGIVEHPYYEQRLSFTGQPINSGIIRLKPIATLFMNKAFNLIRQYCPRLNDIEQEDLQSQSALDCGLEADYACYVAALISENQNIFAISYKSLHSQRNTVANTANAMNRLKRYDKKRGRTTKWEFFVAQEQRVQQPLIKKRRDNYGGSIVVIM